MANFSTFSTLRNPETQAPIGAAQVGKTKIGRPDEVSGYSRNSLEIQQELDFGDGGGGQPPTMGTSYLMDDQPSRGEIQGTVIEMFKISKGQAIAVRTSSGGKWKAPVPPKYIDAVDEGLIGIGSQAVLKKGFGFTSPDWAECVSLTGVPQAAVDLPAFVSRQPSPYPHSPRFREVVAVRTAEILAEFLAQD